MTGSLVVYDRALTATRRSTRCSPAPSTTPAAGVPRLAPPRHRVAARRKGWGAYTSRIGPELLEETFTPFVFAERLKGTRARSRSDHGSAPYRGGREHLRERGAVEAGSDPSKPRHLSLDELPAAPAVTDVLGRAVNSSARRARLPYRGGAGPVSVRAEGVRPGGRGVRPVRQAAGHHHTIDLRRDVLPVLPTLASA